MEKNTALTGLISEMLIKQDRINETLEKLKSASVRQWEQQSRFNERFLDKLNNLKELVR